MNEPIEYLVIYGIFTATAVIVTAVVQHLHVRAYKRHCAYLATLLKAAEERRNKRALAQPTDEG